MPLCSGDNQGHALHAPERREKGGTTYRPLPVRNGGKSAQNWRASYKRCGINEQRWKEKPNTPGMSPVCLVFPGGMHLLTWAGLSGSLSSLLLLLICGAQLLLLLNMDYAVFWS